MEISESNLYSVEKVNLEESGLQAKYPSEPVMIFESTNPLDLGQMSALAFIEWVIENPKGVISLPTGKTPEFMIRWLSHYKRYGYPGHDSKLCAFPNTSELTFVQMDDFFPESHNSFYRYIKQFYQPLLEIPDERIMTIPTEEYSHLFASSQESFLSLREKSADTLTALQQQLKSALEEMDDKCHQYEERIKSLGGIGCAFYGIGPDGHIAFNMQDCKCNVTHITELNYPSAATAACDLGGIQNARNKLAWTIGTDTISYALKTNPKSRAFLCAAGQKKADVIAHTLSSHVSSHYPASCLHGLPGARYYLTHSAATQIESRKAVRLLAYEKGMLPDSVIDEIVCHIALQHHTEILNITSEQLNSTLSGSALLKRIANPLTTVLTSVHNRILSKLSLPPSGKVIEENGPHHDDIMLSHGTLLKEMRNMDNTYHVSYGTSGFTAVSNEYLFSLLETVDMKFIEESADRIFAESKYPLMDVFKQAFINKQADEMARIEKELMLFSLKKVYNLTSIKEVFEQLQIVSDYLHAAPPGAKDNEEVQLFKGTIRELEAERMWHLRGVPLEHIQHMRLSFYKGDLFNPQPSETDILAFGDHIDNIRPDILTVTFDPEGSGPDTHFKNLQAFTEGIRMYSERWLEEGYNPTIWCYRNVWFKFTAAETSLIMPTTRSDMLENHEIFMKCFSSQARAEFPDPDHDGPFTEKCIILQEQQLQDIKTLLGASVIEEHTSVKFRNASGLVYIQQHSLEEYLATVGATIKTRIVQ
ncbi:Glucosamine-6-phosphate deaminase [Oopsacas minuta]|uniref:Glucosamine-6-phosphate deaminase n=1 Tax=Oopsacas minuta TaxID=111878 RepID=A0AAV7JBA7_9METZ|nr:Glucosamine-6-phosphate deaminase [Oopsacas minuta]